jgi:hypothetical protein
VFSVNPKWPKGKDMQYLGKWGRSCPISSQSVWCPLLRLYHKNSKCSSRLSLFKLSVSGSILVWILGEWQFVI